MYRMKVADLVLVVSELAGAFDKVAFGSVLDRQDGWKDLGLSEKKNLFDVLINISETWGSEDVYGGYFVTDEKLWGGNFIVDDVAIGDKPCKIDISEDKLRLNPTRREWLEEWFFGKKGSKEEATKVQKKTKRELYWEFGKKKMEDPKVKKTFKLAIERGYINEKDGRLEWCKQKSLLGFFLGLLICGDTVNRERHFQPTIIKGKCFHSVYFQELFDDKNIGRYRRDLITRGLVPENCGFEEIEKIVSEASEAKATD